METDRKGIKNIEDVSNLKKKTAEPWHIIIENYSKRINSIIEISEIDSRYILYRK